MLIVDDDQTILESTKAILESAGYAVQTAETSRDAIHKVKSDWFDIALLDIDLPDMQGTELLERLQEIKPGMIKIMVTGSASLENAIQSVNLEAKAYIVKPFNPDDLLQVIEEKLKERRAAERLDEDKVTDFIEERLQKLETLERSVKGTNLEVEEAGKIVLHNGLSRTPTSTDAAVKAFETPTSTGGAVKAIETKDLVKRFEDVETMNGTNLETEEGDKIVLHNGMPFSPTSTEGAAAKAIDTPTPSVGAAANAIETTKTDAQAIEVSHLVKQFGAFTAVNDISFSVAVGETFGFLGPNGAGKTTTIRMLTGISPPTSGMATIFGHDIVHETVAARQSMGIVSETSNVYTDLTGWQNMMLAAQLYRVGRSERDKKATELLKRFELHERRGDKVHGYSKGMRRRLTIAMGLVNSPRLLFLDEPTSGLDVESNLIIRDMISDLIAGGVTVFLTTHNIEEANVLCDRVAIIDRGHIAAIDAPERLKKTIQSVQSVEVAFLDGKSPERLDELRSLPMVNDARKEGDKFKLFTENPTEVIEGVMAYAQTHHTRVISITTLGPSLEDVFVKLTGLQHSGGGVTAID